MISPGDRLLGMEDHTLWCDGESAMSNLYVTTAQDFVLSYCARLFPRPRHLLDTSQTLLAYCARPNTDHRAGG